MQNNKRILFSRSTLGWLALAVTAVLLMAYALPGGYDYETTYRPTAEKFLRGETRLYDDASRGYYNAPWLLLFVIPTLPFGLAVGYILFAGLSLVGIAYAVWHSAYLLPEKPSRLTTVLAVITWHTFSLIFLGQVDVVTLVGTVLGWWSIRRRNPWGLSAAFWFLAVKPLNVILVGVLFLLEIRKWTWREMAQAFSLPAVSVILSNFLLGNDWIFRYIENLGADPPDELFIASVWKGARLLGFPQVLVAGLMLAGLVVFLRSAWLQGVNFWTLSQAVTLNLFFSPYAYIHHYVLLIPVFLGLKGRWRAAAYALTWFIIPRAILGPDAAALDVFYPLLLYIAVRQFSSKIS